MRRDDGGQAGGRVGNGGYEGWVGNGGCEGGRWVGNGGRWLKGEPVGNSSGGRIDGR